MSNTGVPGNTIGGSMTHRYYYDDLYRLDSASGDFMGDAGKKARYSLSMSYDKLHNITRKKQDIVQNGIKFGGILKAGYDLTYAYAGNSQQIANIAEQSYRIERSSLSAYQTGIQAGDAVNLKTQCYSYDANGNMTFVATGKLQEDSILQAISTRQLLWDEENRLLAVSDNGFVSNYWYDAAGERTAKQSFDNEGVFINGVLSAGRTSTGKFTAYISPYLVVNNGGYYSKHIYMGSERITSKVGNSGIFSSSPVEVLEQQAKYTLQTGKIKERFDSLGVQYKGIQQTGGLVSSNPSPGADLYFYHPDHLGSSSLITDNNGVLVQHIQYVPFGEVFVEETKSSWSTPYKFNAKELDDETGLYYYGARYYDPRTSVWLSVDPLAEKKLWMSSYVYCSNNPVMRIDPDGRDDFEISKTKEGKVQINVLRTDDKTNTYKYLNADGTTNNLGIYDKKDHMVKLSEKSDFYEQSNYSQGKIYIDGDEAAGLLGAMYQYNQETGNKAYITQLNNSDGGHSAHEGNGTNADLRYANLNGNKPSEAVWTNAINFDKSNSQKLVNSLVEFGFNRPNGKYSILTENAKGNGPALNNTNFVDGKGRFHHKHHMHLQQFNKSIINVVNKKK